MRINVGLPSRGRPLDMVASAISLIRLASGGHDLKITLGIDGDDIPSQQAARDLQTTGVCHTLTLPRHDGLGDLINDLAATTPDDAAFLLWSDRISVTTLQWDHDLALCCMQKPDRPLWLDSVHLTGAGQFILPPLWREVQGKPCPGLFPFWFVDTAIEELDAYVHGFPRISLQSKAAGPRGFKTNRMRDVEFWIDLFAAQRPRRVAEAVEISKKLGLVPLDVKPYVDYFNERDDQMRGRAKALTDAFGELSPPDETYLVVKAEAEKLLGELRS